MEPDDLYGLPFDRFVPERTALVKALRAGKRRDEAASVAALRKPSVAAWAVNQLVRTQARDVDGLFAAGDGLIAAQSDLLAGRGDARTLRVAGNEERAAVDRLVDAARGLLSSQGQELSAPIVERVADTLHAAALDESAREQVRGGRLEHELRHVGLGLGEAPAAASATSRPAKGAKGAARAKGGGDKPAAKSARRREPDADRAAEQQRLAAEKAEQQRAEREQAQARKAARAAQDAARRDAERAARALRQAEERRERAAGALAEADAALEAAREEADAAAREHQRAQGDLEARS